MMTQQTASKILLSALVIAIIALMFVVVSIAQGAEYEHGNIGPYNMTQIDRVVDGDTFNGWAETFIYQTTYMSVRIRGIDAPEMRGSPECEKKMARESRNFMMALLANVKVVIIDDLEYDNFGRIVASVTIDGKDLGEILIKTGHARTYEKGMHGGWCLMG